MQTNHDLGLCPCRCTCGPTCDHAVCPCTECQAARGSTFARDFERALKLGDRHLTIRVQNSLGGPQHGSSQYVKLINLPKGIGEAGGGAEAENNRMSFWVEGFTTNGGSPKSGKVKVEMATSALPREYRLRAKTGAPAVIAKYLADFINKVVAEVPPHFTHTRQ